MSTALDALPRALRRTYAGRMRAGDASRVVWLAHAGDPGARGFVRAVVHDAVRGHARARAWADELAAARQAWLATTTGGFDLFRSIGDAASDIGHAVDSVVKPLGGWSGILSDFQGVISLIPGIGTGISAAIGAAAAVLSGGGPLVIALKTAYGAIPIPPGIRQITDAALDAIIKLVQGGSITDAALAVIRDALPEGIARDAFDTLAHVIGAAASSGKGPPVQHAPAQMHAHYATQYTQGLGAAVAHGLKTIVPPGAAASIAAIPGPHQGAPLPPLRAIAAVSPGMPAARARPAPPAPPRAVAPSPMAAPAPA